MADMSHMLASRVGVTILVFTCMFCLCMYTLCMNCIQFKASVLARSVRAECTCYMHMYCVWWCALCNTPIMLGVLVHFLQSWVTRCVCWCACTSPSGGVQFCSATYRLFKVNPSEQCREKDTVMEVQYKGG